MFCTNCGANNEDAARFCEKCGARMSETTSGGEAYGSRTASPVTSEHVPNYLVQAILVTIFCCQPFGIVSIVFAAQVNGKLESGDIEAARGASQSAKRWAWVAFGVGAALYGGVALIYGALIVFALVAGS